MRLSKRTKIFLAVLVLAVCVGIVLAQTLFTISFNGNVNLTVSYALTVCNDVTYSVPTTTITFLDRPIDLLGDFDSAITYVKGSGSGSIVGKKFTVVITGTFTGLTMKYSWSLDGTTWSTNLASGIQYAITQNTFRIKMVCNNAGGASEGSHAYTFEYRLTDV